MTEINSQSLEDTQVEHILQKYTYDKYTFGKYTFGKFTFEKYTTLYALRLTVFGDQLNGLGTSWLGGKSPPRSKVWKEMYFVFFLFERPILRYL